MRRRDVLKAIPVVAAGGGVAWLVRRWSTDSGEVDASLEALGERLPPHLLSSSPGVLSDEDKQPFSFLSQAIGQRWGLDSLMSDDLFSVLDLKTQFAPSYLAEYRNALRFLRATGPGQWDELITMTLELEMPTSSPWLSRAQHFRRYVFEEILSLHLIRGGCRRFGVRNFRGYMTDIFDYQVAEL